MSRQKPRKLIIPETETKRVGTPLKLKTQFETVRDMSIVVSLFLQGYNFNEIGIEWLKRVPDAKTKLSVLQIGKIITYVTNEWKKQNVVKISELKNMELAKIDALESEYWLAWRRSCSPFIKKEVKKQRIVVEDGIEVSENGDIEPRLSEELQEVEVKEIENLRDGNPKFLEGVERCITNRAKMLGLFAPIVFTPSGIPLDHSNEEYAFGLPEIYQRFITVIQNNNININNQDAMRNNDININDQDEIQNNNININDQDEMQNNQDEIYDA